MSESDKQPTESATSASAEAPGETEMPTESVPTESLPTQSVPTESVPTVTVTLDSEEDSEQMAGKMKELRKTRKSRVGQLTRYMNVIKDLMKDATNVHWVKANASTYNATLKQFKEAHTQYQQMLSEEEREDDTKTWFQPKWEIICEFVDDLLKWQSSFNAKSPAGDQKDPSVTSKRSSSRSERVQAEAERAALMAKAAALKEKHELELEEERLNLRREQIRRKKEMLDVQGALSATSAKINVWENADYADASQDGMNEYLEQMEKHGTETEFKDFATPTPTVHTASVRPKTETRLSSIVSRAPTQPAQPAQSTSQMQNVSSQHTAPIPEAARTTVGADQLHRVLEISL